MIARLWRLLFHAHNWETIDNVRITYMDGAEPTSTGRRYILRCKDCGTIKAKDII